MLRRASFLLLLAGATLSAHSRFQEYALILKDPPLTRQLSPSASRPAILEHQAALIAELKARRVSVSGAVQQLLNAVFVLVPAGPHPELENLPGVERVQYMAPLRPLLNKALDLSHVPAAWSTPPINARSNAGAGIRIGIIDTGLDQTHPAFQDPTLTPPPGFPKGNTAFTNSKVIVARSYVDYLNYNDPRYSTPDDVSPADHVGHGTAIAMIAAGNTVNAPVATITGVAPRAFLGNYKIYGSPGLNDVTRAGALIAALEDAYTDGMDIVNVASGAPAAYEPLAAPSDNSCGVSTGLPSYIPANACDVYSQAIENAVRKGVTVVIGAGDDGETGYSYPAYGTINAPGTAPSAITVGAAYNAHVLLQSLRVSGPGVPAALQQVDTLFGSGPRPASAITLPLNDVTRTGDDGTACRPLPANSLNGAAAVVVRGGCSFEIKADNVQAAGGRALILYLDNASDAIFTPTQLAATAIPTVLIDNTGGLALRSYLAATANVGASVTLDPAYREVAAPSNAVASFSSRGPAIGSYSPNAVVASPGAPVKPELVAIGSDLYTATQYLDSNADLWNSTRYTTVQGTSFAAALVSGAAALVKQAHPGWTPAFLKSALVNTSGNEVTENNAVARIAAVGAGNLNAANAVGATLLADPSTLSFNNVLAITGLPVTLNLALSNGAASGTATYSVQVQQRDPHSRASVTVSPSSGSLNAGQSQTLQVRLSGSTPNPGSYEGFLVISGSAETIHVPYWYIVSDQVPQNIFAVINGSFTGPVGEANDLVGFRLVDRWGLGVSGAAVSWKIVSGAATFGNVDAQTDGVGIAAAQVTLPSTAQQVTLEADSGSFAQQFFLTVVNPPTLASNGVVNAASFQPGPIAPGAYLTIAGTSLSPTSGAFRTPQLPVSLLTTSVSFDAGALSFPGYIAYASPSQLNVQVPWELQGQTSAVMKVTVGGIPSATTTVQLGSASPAFFEFNDPGNAQLEAAALDRNYGLVTRANPVARGQIVQLYLNGLGAVSNQPASGYASPANPLAMTPSQPVVTIGGQNAPVQFSGLAPGIVGLYQVNVTVPAGLQAGTQPLVVQLNGVTSKTSQLPVK